MDPIMFKPIHPHQSSYLPVSLDLAQINCSQHNFLELNPPQCQEPYMSQGVSSSSPKLSAKSLKVSMGKREYQTWDKGDFSFPITRIRENIVVALLDAGGNEIAHQDIGTMQIIEKGCWDEVFSINGGGQVHLKLLFTLSEEDRSRIRVMRESAMKKKLETNPNIKLRFLEAVASTSYSAQTSVKDDQQVSASTKGLDEIDITSPEVEASQAGSSPASAASSAVSLPNHPMDRGLVSDSAIPNATDGIQDVPSSPVRREIDVESAQVPDEKIEAPRLADVRSDNADTTSSKLPRSSVSEKNSSVASTLQNDQDASSSLVRNEIDVKSAQAPDEKIEAPRLADVRPDNGDTTLSKLPRSSVSEKSSVAFTLQDDLLVDKPQKQSPVRKIPSNVRKMISAFETGQNQEVKSMKRAASVPSQLNRSNKEGFLEDRPRKSVVSSADKTPTDFKDRQMRNLHELPTTGKFSREYEPSQVVKELPSTVTPTLSEESVPSAEDISGASSSKEKLKEGEKSAVDMRRQLASETATSSGRMSEERSQVPQETATSSGIMSEERSQVPQPYELSSRLLKSSEASAPEGSGRGRGTGLKSSTMTNAKVASNLKQKTLEYYKEKYDSAQTSGMWIFPDNTGRLCITTAGEEDMKLVGHYNNETKPQQANNISSKTEKNSMHDKEHKTRKNPKKLDHQPESGSPNDSSNGLVGQVLKVAVIVGFGVLVLLTRQKEPRTKQKEDKDKDSLFHIPDYVDERTLKPWMGIDKP